MSAVDAPYSTVDEASYEAQLLAKLGRVQDLLSAFASVGFKREMVQPVRSPRQEFRQKCRFQVLFLEEGKEMTRGAIDNSNSSAISSSDSNCNNNSNSNSNSNSNK